MPAPRSRQPAATRWGARRTLIGALLVGGAVQVLIPLAPAVPAIAMTLLIMTQVIGDGALTVYLINETTLRQRLLPPEALGRAAATWQVATGLLTPAGALVGAALAEKHRHAADVVDARDRHRARRRVALCLPPRDSRKGAGGARSVSQLAMRSGRAERIG